MPRQLPFVAIASLLLAVPLFAQEVTMGVFTQVRMPNVADFEEAAVDHAAWHRDQSDPQSWVVYQALTGPQIEYVFVAADMPWSQLDNPSIDMNADIAHWASNGAEYAESEDARLWSGVEGMGNQLPEEMALDYPVIRVIEFEVLPGGEGAVQNGMRMFKEAMDDQSPDAYYAWSRVVSWDGPTSVFVAVWAPTFEALGTPAATPLQRIIDHFGPEMAMANANAFAQGARITADRIWLLRPDLSYFPGN